MTTHASVAFQIRYFKYPSFRACLSYTRLILSSHGGELQNTTRIVYEVAGVPTT